MGIYINPGSTLFQRSINSPIYIDKTGLIAKTNKLIDTNTCYVCVSRPRRFGKSITLHMLAAYYGKNIDAAPLFDRFSIANDPSYAAHRNKYVVIMLDIQRFLCDNILEMLKSISRTLVKELYKNFSAIVPESDDDLIAYLSQIYDETDEKFIFLFDEWDCVLREKRLPAEEIKKYLDFLRNLLKDQPYVALAYMTGILPIKKYGTHSALNMFTEYSMANQRQLAEFTGFTEKEVYDLCRHYDMDFTTMRNWYDGYELTNNWHIYNPRSVVEAVTNKNVGSYWTTTETYLALKIYIDMNFDGLKDAIIAMLSGESIPINPLHFQNDMTTFTNKDDVLTLLVHLGYLGFRQETSSVFIPNNEIRNEFRLAIESKEWGEVVDLLKESDELLKATWNQDAEKVAELIDRAHGDNTSILTYNNENSLSCVISLAYFSAAAHYTRVREFPTGKGFADIVFLPHQNSPHPALLVELKFSGSAEGALQQIKDRRYPASLKDYHGNMLLVGINYDRNSKKHQCVIETFSK